MDSLYQRADKLQKHILSWWEEYVILPEGLAGSVDSDNRQNLYADRGLILAARVLWTFSEAFRVTGNIKYKEVADKLYYYVVDSYIDRTFGGAFFTITWEGTPKESYKHTYGQAFLVYALSAYYRISNREEVYTQAYSIYEFMQKTAYDPKYGGYFECCTRDGVYDLRKLGTNQRAEQVKTMNTSLHVLEAVTSLLRVREDEKVRKSLQELNNLFYQKVIDANTQHMHMFFTQDWIALDQNQSFGHDIEASWLLCEAANVLGKEEEKRKAKENAVKMTERVFRDGMADVGLLYAEWSPEFGYKNTHYSWWEQNEAVVGTYNVYQITGKRYFEAMAERILDLIETVFVDKERGGYYPYLQKNLDPVPNQQKANMWICPYHNVRMCLELMERIGIK